MSVLVTRGLRVAVGAVPSGVQKGNVIITTVIKSCFEVWALAVDEQNYYDEK